MKISYNSSNPYTFWVNIPNKKSCQVINLFQEKQKKYVDKYSEEQNKSTKYFADFCIQEELTFNNDEELGNFKNLWIKNLEILFPQYIDEIDKIINFWNENQYPELSLFSYDSIVLKIHKFKNYRLFDIFSYPGDNEYGVIFLEYQNEFYPVFTNLDQNLAIHHSNNKQHIQILIDMIQNRILSFERARISSEYPNSINDFSLGKTTLMECCEHGNFEAVKFLVDQGADLDIQDSDGNTAIIYAYNFNHQDCLFYLIHNGANLDTLTKKLRSNDDSEFIELITNNTMDRK